MDMIRSNSGIAGGIHSITSPSAHNATPRTRSSLVVSPIVIFDSYKNGTAAMSSRSNVVFVSLELNPARLVFQQFSKFPQVDPRGQVQADRRHRNDFISITAQRSLSLSINSFLIFA